MPQLYAALVIVTLIAVAVNELLRLAETRFGRWRQSA
jgi:ABC-type nitrate/sulfonate/bicarbonate transport system permease component